MAVAAEALLRLKTVFDGGGLDSARKALGGLEREAKGVRGSLKDVVSSATWQGAAAAATGIGAGLVYSAKKAIELETQMVQVRKVVEFDSPNGLKRLTQDLVDLSTKVPYTAKELAELAASAGMAGYAEKDIMKFVNAASQMGTAFNMSAGEAGDAMVAFQAAMGLSLDDAIKLGDAINHLSDNLQGVVEPAALTEVVKRIGAIGIASGLSAKDVAALGAAFLAPGTASEVAATGMKNFLKALTIGDAGSDSFKAAFGKLGLEAQQVATDMQTKALPTIKDVLTRIAALPKDMQAGVITKIFGEESKAAIMPLLTNLKLVDQAFGLVSKESAFAGSMQKEFNNQLNSTDAQLKLFKNNLDAVALSLGQAILPGVNAFLSALRPVLQAVGFLSQKIPGFSALIVGLGAAFAGLVISAPFVSSLITVAGALSRLGILATIAGWLGAVGPWLARLSPWLLQIGTVVARIGPILSSIVPVLLTVGRVLLGIFTGPVGWFTLLATAALAAYTFRDQLAPVFTAIGTLWNTYVVGPIRTGWTALVTWFSTTMAGVGQGLGAAWQAISGFFNTYVITPIKAMWDGFVFYVLQTIQAYAIVWWQGVTAGFQTNVVVPIQTAWNGLISLMGTVGAQLSMIWAGIASNFQAWVVVPIQTGWGSFTQWFYQSAGTVKQWLMGLWVGVSQNFTNWVVAPIQQGWGALVQWLSTSVGTVRGWFGSMWNGLAQGFQTQIATPIQSIWNGVLSYVRNAWTSTTGWFQQMFINVTNFFRSNLVVPIRNMWDGLVSGIRGLIDQTFGWLRNLGNSAVNKINAVRQAAGFEPIPGFARGGHVSGPTLAWVGEGGDPGGEYIIPAKKMAGASMAYLSGARGASVIDGKIPGFASGGFVESVRPYLPGPPEIVRPEIIKGPKNMGKLYSIGDGIYSTNPNIKVRKAQVSRPGRSGSYGKTKNTQLSMKSTRRSKKEEIESLNAWLRQASRGSGRMDSLGLSIQYQMRLAEIMSGSSQWIRGGSAAGSLMLDLFGLRRMAAGGFVNRPTLAWVGEGKDSEYVIPSSRMASSAMAYLNGARGAAVLKAPGFASGGYVGGPDRSGNPLQALIDRVGTIDSLTLNEPPQINDGPIQVTTGPVLEFDGQRYVTMDDYQRGLREVKRQTLGDLRTAAGRRATGRG